MTTKTLASRSLAVLFACTALGAGRAQTEKPIQGRAPDKSWFEAQHLYHRPRGGYVTKKTTAIAIGKAIVDEVYGEGAVAQNEPFDARKFDDVWLVYSYVPKSKDIVGGGYTVEISASTGAVMNVTLTQ